MRYYAAARNLSQCIVPRPIGFQPLILRLGIVFLNYVPSL